MGRETVIKLVLPMVTDVAIVLDNLLGLVLVETRVLAMVMVQED